MLALKMLWLESASGVERRGLQIRSARVRGYSVAETLEAKIPPFEIALLMRFRAASGVEYGSFLGLMVRSLPIHGVRDFLSTTGGVVFVDSGGKHG
jgi:hypothetical protein